MNAPKKHHYLPQFFMRRWANPADGRVVEYRRPQDVIVRQRRFPAETGYLTDLYANANKDDPVEKQALELLFMQQVDDRAAQALEYLEQYGRKPADPVLRDSWSRFLMSLLHRTPERVKHITEHVKQYEDGILNPGLKDDYAAIRGPDDPETYEDWLAEQQPLTPDLTVKLLRLVIDSARIGNTLNAMRWTVFTLERPRFGFLTGDQPLIMSNGLGHDRSFVVLAIGPTRLFIAAHQPAVIKAFINQRPNGIETGANDACARQARHMLIAPSDAQARFIDRRFLRRSVDPGPNGLATWNVP